MWRAEISSARPLFAWTFTADHKEISVLGLRVWKQVMR